MRKFNIGDRVFDSYSGEYGTVVGYQNGLAKIAYDQDFGCESNIDLAEDIYLCNADDGIFFFGGYHFIPYRKFRKGEMDRQNPNDSRPWKNDAQFAMRYMHSDYKLCISKYDWRKCEYSLDDFYAASGKSSCDIFRCLENGKFYVPGENELFCYDKSRKGQ